MVLSLVQILLGFVWPAALVLVAGWWAAKSSKDRRWIFGPVAAIGFGLAYRNIEPSPGWPPNANVIYLLFYLPMGLGVLTLTDSLLRPPLWLRAILLAILWRLCVHIFLARQIPGTLSRGSAERWSDASTVIMLLWWLTFETIAKWWLGVTVPILLAGLSAACAVVLALGWHIQSSGLLAAAVFAMCSSGLILGAFSSRELFSRGFAQMMVFILQLLLFHGYFYTDDELNTKQQLLVAMLVIAPLLAFTGAGRKVREWSRLWQIFIRVLLVFAALGVVCAITARDFVVAAQSPAGGED